MRFGMGVFGLDSLSKTKRRFLFKLTALALACSLVSCAGIVPQNAAGDPPSSTSRPPFGGGSPGTGNGSGTTNESSDTVPATYFGMHIHHLENGTPWPSVPIGSYRLWDAGVIWSLLEPERGVWDFSRLDLLVAEAQQHGTDLLLTFGPTPLWAASDPSKLSSDVNSSCSAPASLQDWDDYVKAVVTRYKGLIKEYEIWDEINVGHTYCGTVQEMVALAKDAYAIIRTIDPSAIVLSPNVTVHTTWLDNFLASGGMGTFDVVSFHFYTAYDLPGPTAAPPEGMLVHVNALRQTLAKYGLQQLRIWDTESGWWNHTFTPDLAAAYVARAYILLWASGIDRQYWYSWDNHSFISLHLTDLDSTTPTPAGIAYSEMEKWLVGASLSGCGSDTSGTWTCQLKRGTAVSWIVWNQSGPATFSVPANWSQIHSQTDVLGGLHTVSNQSEIGIGQSPLLLQ